jgi:hypothetical protein
MNLARWLVIHSLKSFSEHPDMIGVISSKGNAEPMYQPFARIARGDEIAYYAIRDCVVVGLFKVMSSMEYLDDSIWGPSCVFKIVSELLPPSSKVLDFKKLLQDPQTNFDLFPNKKNWSAYLRGHASRPLTQRDFETVRLAIQNPKLLISTPQIRTP